MNNSEDSQRIEEVEHVQNDDQCVHLILLHVSIGPVNHINILFSFTLLVIIIIENWIYIPIIGHLRVIELHQEENDNKEISDNRQFIAISFSIQS